MLVLGCCHLVLLHVLLLLTGSAAAALLRIGTTHAPVAVLLHHTATLRVAGVEVGLVWKLHHVAAGGFWHVRALTSAARSFHSTGGRVKNQPGSLLCPRRHLHLLVSSEHVGVVPSSNFRHDDLALSLHGRSGDLGSSELFMSGFNRGWFERLLVAQFERLFLFFFDVKNWFGRVCFESSRN